jgi:hypothetical protein
MKFEVSTVMVALLYVVHSLGLGICGKRLVTRTSIDY